MSLQGRCIVCAHSLKIPHRSDARYCGSTCRVRAFRARRQTRSGQHGSRRAEQYRTEGATTKTRLAIFRELRQTRKQAADLRQQLANQARTAAALESKLGEMTSVALAQRDVLSRTTERRWLYVLNNWGIFEEVLLNWSAHGVACYQPVWSEGSPTPSTGSSPNACDAHGGGWG